MALENYKSDSFKTKSGKILNITFLHHASLVFGYEEKFIYIDPVSEYLGNNIDFKSFPKADFIIITHEHWDHFNPETIAMLRKPETIIIANPNVCKLLNEGTVMRNGDTITLFSGIILTAVPAYNITEGHLEYHPKGRDNGYIFEFDSLRIYVSGDTENIPELKEIKNIDIAFLSVNQPYTMTTDQCIKAALTIKPKILYPYHYHETNEIGRASCRERVYALV